MNGVNGPPIDSTWVDLTDAPLPVAEASAWATTAAAGAVVTFVGVVRDHSEGRPGVTGITYEAYAEPARRSLREIARATRLRWPAVERIVVLHRTGDLGLSEASVLVVVSSAHREVAFEAARFAIDTVKASAPIWKREHWAKGSDWVESTRDVQSVGESALAHRE